MQGPQCIPKFAEGPNGFPRTSRILFRIAAANAAATIIAFAVCGAMYAHAPAPGAMSTVFTAGAWSAVVTLLAWGAHLGTKPVPTRAELIEFYSAQIAELQDMIMTMGPAQKPGGLRTLQTARVVLAELQQRQPIALPAGSSS